VLFTVNHHAKLTRASGKSTQLAPAINTNLTCQNATRIRHQLSCRGCHHAYIKL